MPYRLWRLSDAEPRSWLGRKDSNLQHAVSETADLPIDLLPSTAWMNSGTRFAKSIPSFYTYRVFSLPRGEHTQHLRYGYHNDCVRPFAVPGLRLSNGPTHLLADDIGTPGRTRTFNMRIWRPPLYHWSYRCRVPLERVVEPDGGDVLRDLVNLDLVSIFGFDSPSLGNVL